MEETPSRRSLGEFLRSRRERLSPEEVGLISYGQRRTAGLRREEVAQLAHIGTSWYTALEQGRHVNPSDDVLNNIAKALRLTEDERVHLHLLAKPGQPATEEEPQLHAGLVGMIRALDPHPAFILGRYWDLLTWNKAAAFVFRLPPFSQELQPKPHWIKHLFAEARTGLRIDEWEDRAQIVIAHFRADYARYQEDRRFAELIEELSQTSPLFRKIWPLHDVQAITDRHKKSYDPRIGEMAFEHVVLQPPSHPELKVMIYTASAETAARLETALRAAAHR